MEEIKITGQRLNIVCGYTGDPDAHTHNWFIAKQGHGKYVLVVDDKRYFDGTSITECLIEVAHITDEPK